MNRKWILYLDLFFFVGLFTYILFAGIIGTSLGVVGVIVWSILELVVVFGIHTSLKDIENFKHQENKELKNEQ